MLNAITDSTQPKFVVVINLLIKELLKVEYKY